MASQEKNKKIVVNQEIFGTLCLIKAGALGKFAKLMNSDEISQSMKDGKFKNEPMPFVFMFAPSDKISQNRIQNAKTGEKIPLVCDGEIIGEITCESIFETKNFKNCVSIFDICHEKIMPHGQIVEFSDVDGLTFKELLEIPVFNEKLIIFGIYNQVK